MEFVVLDFLFETADMVYNILEKLFFTYGAHEIIFLHPSRPKLPKKKITCEPVRDLGGNFSVLDLSFERGFQHEDKNFQC